jgi:DNA polymerase-3 subunit beta
VKLTCTQQSLAAGLATVGRAVAARSTLPVLANILLATDGGRLKLAATNLDLGITTWIDVDVASEGATTVPARLLGEFVGSLPKEPITLDLDAKRGALGLACASYKANLKSIGAEEFPALAVESDEGISLDPAALREAIGQVGFAAATDDSRPALAGILMAFREEGLTLVATDGFRLSTRQIALERAAEDLDIIVPAKALQELARLLSGQTEPVRVSLTPNRSQVLFRLGSVELVSRLIEASFPPYRQIIPTSHTTRLLVGTKDIRQAVKVAGYFASEHSIVNLAIGEGRVQIGAKAVDVGDAAAGIDASVEGEAVEIKFNAKYLADALGVVDTAQVSLEFTSATHPCVVRPVGVEGCTHVVMPITSTR